METHITKSLLRKTVLQYRKLLGQSIYTERSERLLQRLNMLIKSKDPRKLHTFLAIDKNNEVDISPLFEMLWAEEILLVVSKTDFKLREMMHYELKVETELLKNSKGIPEPVNAKEATLDDLDLILVPLLVCDTKGYRIGYGGGYYDRLLAETKAIKVGLSLSPPVDYIIQSEKWDVPLDYLITPFKTYNHG